MPNNAFFGVFLGKNGGNGTFLQLYFSRNAITWD